MILVSGKGITNIDDDTNILIETHDIYIYDLYKSCLSSGKFSKWIEYVKQLKLKYNGIDELTA